MEDLEILREAWGQPEPPAHAACSAAMATLLEHAAAARAVAPGRASRPARLHRGGWLAAGLTATVAATAAVAVAVSGGTAPVSSRPGLPVAGRSQGISQLSGKQILLRAAIVATTRPEGSGAYWYVKEAFAFPSDGAPATQQTWTDRQGTTWVLDLSGTGVWLMSGPGAWPMSGPGLTFRQLQRLPADPAALIASISSGFQGISRPAEAATADVAITLLSLLSGVPIQPDVRAAAFRALASLPDVKNLGRVTGGQKLLISVDPPPARKFPSGRVPAGAGKITVVLDPATAQVRSTTDWQGTDTVITAHWTSQRPPVVQPPAKSKG
jgi:hypothetical protein